MFLYQAVVVPLGLMLGLIICLFNKKWRRTFQLRLKPIPWPNWIGQAPTLWIHCASGEFEYAKPLLREWKKLHPDWKICVSYFSPSFKDVIEKTKEVDLSFPLPFDLPGPMHSLFKKIKPECVAISRTDLWPQMLNCCQKNQVPAILFSATCSLKTRWIQYLSPILRWRYQGLTQIYCVSEEDQKNLKKIGLKCPIKTLGDTRYDQVIHRLSLNRRVKSPPSLDSENSLTLVAGSTWPEDENVVIPSCAPFIKQNKLRLIVVPHEPTPNHLSDLKKLCKQNQLEWQLYSQMDSNLTTKQKPDLDLGEQPIAKQAKVILVDQVGLLAEAYKWGQIAFVGGSFKKSVHSVMEPLAAGKITFVGPYHHNNREALEFKTKRLILIMETKTTTEKEMSTQMTAQLNLVQPKMTMVQEIDDKNSLEHFLSQILDHTQNFSQWETQILKEVLPRQGATSRIIHEMKQDFNKQT